MPKRLVDVDGNMELRIASRQIAQTGESLLDSAEEKQAGRLRLLALAVTTPGLQELMQSDADRLTETSRLLPFEVFGRGV